MKKLKLFFACLLMAVLSIGQMWAAEELKATLDFTSQTNWNIPTSGTNTESASFTDGNYTIQLAAATNYKLNSGYLILGKSGSTLTLPAFTWNTTKIVVTGNAGASAAVVHNIFVGETAVSTAITGCAESTGSKPAKVNTFEIASAYQAAGNVYVLKVTSAHNIQISKIEIYGEAGGDDPTPVAVTGVTLDQSEAEVAVGKTITLTPTVAPSDATTKTVTWESNDEDVATVEDGVVTGVAEGTATITVKTVDGNKTATCEVTVTPAPAAVNYELVTNVNDLADAAEIIIVNIDEDKAISTTQASSNRTATAVSSTSHVIAAGDDVQVITLEASSSNWKLSVGEDSYLYASSNSSNQLKTAKATTAGDNGVWAITIANDGAATVIAQGTNARNNMRYNPNNGSAMFSCYASTSDLGLVKIFKKVDGTVKPSAELSYAAADQKKLTKLGEAFTAPTLENPHTVAVTYASNNTDVAEVAANGAVTIKAAGVAVITASFAGNDDYKAGSASYTIGVTAHAGTETDPFVAADVKIVVDAVETLENAYATGIVSNVVTTTLPTEGYITFYFSANGLTSGQQVEAFKCYGLNSAPFEALTDVKTGATVVITGTLKKYNSTYEFDANCHLVSYTAPAAPKQSIANDQANPYTVAQAITFAANGITYDLDDYVYVQGVVYDVQSFNNGAMNIFIKDANAENQFELYKCAGINDGSTTTPFDALSDVQAGNIVIGYGQLSYHAPYYEFKQGNYLVDLQKPATGIELDATAEVEVGSTVNLTATILPSNATGTIVWSVESGSDNASVDAGVVTGKAEGEAVIRATVQGTEIHAECTVTVTAASAPLTDYYEKVTETAGIVEGTYLIVYEDGSVAFDGGLDDSDNDHKLDKASNTIAVAITSDYKIGVTSATEAATFYIDPTAGTIQSASGKYIGVTSNSNGLKTSDNADAYTNSFAIDGDGNAIIGAVFSESTMTLRYNTDAGQKRFRYYKTTGSPAGQLYKLHGETVKADPNLAWSGDVEQTVGTEFTSPTLTHADGLTETITYTSDKEAVATVDANGVISVVENATGTAHITASYPGDASFKAGSAVCTIKINPAHSIYVSPSLTVNFGSVTKDATVEDKVITITLTEVPNATATLDVNPEVFSFTPAALTASGDITISASSATVGVFESKLTISDDAGLATSRVVTLKLTVTDPAAAETPISTSTKWVAATAADLVDGAEVIITGVKDEVTYAMGEQKNTNRAAYVASIDGEGVLTPGEGTMAFTLVDQGDGTYAIRTSNGKYLYAAKNDANHLKTQDEVDVNAKWTLTVASAVAEGSSNRNIMRFNGGSTKLFSCYSSGQEDIKFYVPKPVTPTKYSVTIDALIANGSVVSDKATAEENEEVTLTITADAGYELSALTINGNDVTSSVSGNSYSFNMPAEAVTVNATFSLIPTPATPDYTRDVTNGHYGTICLPKAGTIEGATLYEIGSFENSLIYIDEVGTTLTAGVPYIFYASGAQLNVYYTDKTADDVPAGDANGLFGFYNLSNPTATYDIPEDAGNYILYNDQYWLVSGRAAYIANYRAYIKLGSITPKAAAPGRRRVAMAVNGENAAQGFENIESGDKPMKVMIEGTMYILRGEKVYDATGRLVK